MTSSFIPTPEPGGPKPQQPFRLDSDQNYASHKPASPQLAQNANATNTVAAQVLTPGATNSVTQPAKILPAPAPATAAAAAFGLTEQQAAQAIAQIALGL